MERIVSAFVRRVWSFLYLLIKKLFHWNSLHFNSIESLSTSTSIELDGGSLAIGKKVSTKRNVHIEVHKNAEVIIGDGCFFNANCTIASLEGIYFGNSVSMGPGCVVYDHDHDFRADGGKNSGKYITKKIKIGDNVWIGAGCVILKGVTIGRNAVIGAGAVITEDVHDNQIIVQKRTYEVREIAKRTE